MRFTVAYGLVIALVIGTGAAWGWLASGIAGLAIGIAAATGTAFAGVLLGALVVWVLERKSRQLALAGASAGILILAAAGWLLWQETRGATPTYSEGDVLRVVSSAEGTACRSARWKPGNRTWVVECARGKTFIFDDRTGRVITSSQ